MMRLCAALVLLGLSIWLLAAGEAALRSSTPDRPASPILDTPATDGGKVDLSSGEHLSKITALKGVC